MPAPKRYSLLALLAMALLAGAMPAGALIYQAPLDRASWQLERTPKACRLRQAIPRIGDAVIETSGGSERFFVQLTADGALPVEGPLTPGSAQLAAAAPFWSPEREARPLGSVAVAAGGRMVDIGGDQVTQLLRGLKEGLAAEIRGRARRGEAAIQVVALPVYFRRAWRDYDACVQKLPPPSAPRPIAVAKPSSVVAGATAKPAKVNTAADGLVFEYAPGEWQLQATHRAALDGLMQALTLDRTLRVAIDGYGNDSYRRLLNLELSRKRVQAVSDYLSARGVDLQRITMRYHGDEKVSARRVLVKVERTGAS